MSLVDILGLREYQNWVDEAPEVKCCDCPFYREPQGRQRYGRCITHNDNTGVPIRDPNNGHVCFTFVAEVLKVEYPDSISEG